MVGWGGTSSAMLKNSVGAFGGEELHTMTETEIAPHDHESALDVPDGPYLGRGTQSYSGSGSGAFGAGGSAYMTSSTGSATPFNVVQPSLVLRPFIRY
jgi:hypothetical protein